MRDLNTVGQKSVAESKRDVKMGSPRPSYGRARNYGTQGRNEYGRLGGPRNRTKLRKFLQLGLELECSVITSIDVYIYIQLFRE